MTLKELREKLGAKQTELGTVFDESKVVIDGKSTYDFTRVKCLGDEVRGSVAVAEKVQQMNAELNELAKEAEDLDAAERAAKDHDDREKRATRITHPNSEGKGDGFKATKSLGAQVTGEKAFIDWVANGAAGGISFKYPDMVGSDFVAKSAQPMTMATKTLFQTSAGWDPEFFRQPGFVEAVTRPIQLLDIIPLAQTDSDTVSWMLETTRTHAAAEKNAGAAYAESTFVFAEQTSPVQKITDSLPVTDEQLADVALINSYINDRLSFGVRQRLDTQILVGNGTPPNLDGLLNVSGILTQAKGGDPTPDAFFKLMTKIRTTGRAVPTHCLIHPTDWEQVRLLRTADGIYIWGNPSESGPERLWGLPVVQIEQGSAGTGYVGSFQPAWINLVERSGVDIQVGYVGDQFVQGKRTIRASMRAAFVVRRPAAFGTVTGI